MKQALVYLNDILAAKLIEDDMGYEFRYDTDYLHRNDAVAVSLTLPLTDKPFFPRSDTRRLAPGYSRTKVEYFRPRQIRYATCLLQRLYR